MYSALETDYNNAFMPTSYFNSLFCDSFADFAISIFSEMLKFVNMSNISFSIFTRNIVSYDSID